MHALARPGLNCLHQKRPLAEGSYTHPPLYQCTQQLYMTAPSHRVVALTHTNITLSTPWQQEPNSHLHHLAASYIGIPTTPHTAAAGAAAIN
jgi:hypothetical protein